MLSARFLKINTQGQGQGGSSKDSRVFARWTFLHPMLEWPWPPGDRLGRPVLVLISHRAACSDRRQELPAERRSIGVRDHSSRARGDEPRSTEVITNRITNAIRQQTPEVSYTLVQIAGDGPKTRNLASIYVRLTPIEDRRRDQFAVMDDVRSRVLPPLASGLRTAVQPVANIGGGGNQNADIQFIINGPDLAKLDTYSKQLVARVRQMKGVVDVDTSLNAGKPEVSVRVDRPKAATWECHRRRAEELRCWWPAIR